MNKDIYKNLEEFHFSEEIREFHRGKNKLRAMVFGNFGAMNYGDEAILAGEIQELRKLPGIGITAVGRYPEQIQKLHNVPGVSMYDLPSIIRELGKSDFVIVGGGGLINKMERGPIGFFYQLYMLLMFFFLPLLFGKKLYALGIGVYSNANAVILSLTKLLLENAKIVTVRDQHSLSFLAANQESILSKKVRLYKDNSFLMDLLPENEVKSDAFFKEHLRKDRLQIGISLVKPENQDEEEHLLQELASFMAENSKKADFWFYSLDCNPAYFNDEMFGKKLVEKVSKKIYSSSEERVEKHRGGDTVPLPVLDSIALRSNNKIGALVHFIPADWSPERVFSSFGLMDYMIATRFHAAVFAYRTGINFTGISYDKKCASFLKSIGKEPVEIRDVASKYLQEELHKSVQKTQKTQIAGALRKSDHQKPQIAR